MGENERDEFDEFMAADETILELSLNDFIPTLYNYKQAKQLLQCFNLPFTRGMKKDDCTYNISNRALQQRRYELGAPGYEGHGLLR
jgi:hypothetical protein